jgi:hypothetical protein
MLDASGPIGGIHEFQALMSWTRRRSWRQPPKMVEVVFSGSRTPTCWISLTVLLNKEQVLTVPLHKEQV